jgi:DNA repair protein RadC
MAPQKSSGDETCPGGDVDYGIRGSAWRVRDLPLRMRPREQVERFGVESVSDEVLLAVVLRSGVKGVNVVELARSLLKDYGSLTGIASRSIAELAKRKGMGGVKAQVLAAALELAKRLGEENAPERPSVRHPGDAARVLRDSARTLDNEMFWVLLLDAKNRLKGKPVNISKGLLDASLVHPREVFKEAIRSATAAVVIAHNHPSGDPTPSSEDIRITKQMIEAGNIIDIKVLDHVILGRSDGKGARDYVSMREAGLVRFDQSFVER